MLPIRAVVESVGLDLAWEGSTSTITISGSTASADDTGAQLVPTIPTAPEIPSTPTENRSPSLHPDHIIIRERQFFTQEELRAMIAVAPDMSETRHLNPHPNRAMTPEEVRAWSEEYFAMGGLNRQELEMIYFINEERIAHGLKPFWVCPYLSQGSRLTSQLLVEREREPGSPLTHRGLPSHNDPYYGFPGDRARLFHGGVTGWENLAGVPTDRAGTAAVSAWMNSPGHRRNVLSDTQPGVLQPDGRRTSNTLFVGVGFVDIGIIIPGSGGTTGIATMKSSAMDLD